MVQVVGRRKGTFRSLEMACIEMFHQRCFTTLRYCSGLANHKLLSHSLAKMLGKRRAPGASKD